VTVEEACRPEKVRVFGPAIEERVVIFQPTYFVVDCVDAGPGDQSAHAIVYLLLLKIHRVGMWDKYIRVQIPLLSLLP